MPVLPARLQHGRVFRRGDLTKTSGCCAVIDRGV
jgi:hypothetical protein